MKLTKLIGFAIAAQMAVGCVYVEHGDGSGVASTERHELGAVSEVEINGVFESVAIEICDCDTLVIVRGDDNVVPEVDLDLDDDRLEVNGGDGWNFDVPLEVRIQTRDLTKLEFNGVGRLSVNGVFAEDFEVHNNGVGSIKLRGEARRLEVENAGTGSTDASRLVAKNAAVNNAGTGDVEVCATAALDATVAGTGSVFYSCEPASIDSNVTGTGSIVRR